MPLSMYKAYVLAECCKLLTFCRTVLIERFHDAASVGAIQADIDKQIAALREEIEKKPEQGTKEVKSKDKDDKTEDENKIKEKDKTKIVKKSIKYLKNTSDALRKSVLNEQPTKGSPKALPAPPVT